jgi:tetratricopeptide (TPR) repeat protein
MRHVLRRLAAHGVARDAVVRDDTTAAVELRRNIIESGLQARTSDLPDDLLHLAALLVRYGRSAEAVGWFAELDRCTADNHRLKLTILIRMAYDLSSLGRYEEAESALQRASTLVAVGDQWLLRRRLRSGTVRWDLAMAHGYVASLSGRVHDARRWYESALSLSKRLPRAKRLVSLHNLASTDLELGDLENAERRVEEVNQLAGSQPWSGRDRFLRLTGNVRLAQGRLQEARDVFNGLLVLRGSDPGALHSLAEVAIREGLPEEASAYLARIGTDPLDASSRRRLAETLDQLAAVDEVAGRPVEAEARRRRVLTLNEKPLPQVPLPDDPLLRLVRSAFAGQCFGQPGPVRSFALGLYLSAFFCLGLSILLPLDLVFPIPLMQVVALVLLILGFSPFTAWVMALRPCAVSPA